MSRDRRTWIRKGFKILECKGREGDTYYTVVNPKFDNHVHTKSLDYANKVCDEARNLLTIGICKTNIRIIRILAMSLLGYATYGKRENHIGR